MLLLSAKNANKFAFPHMTELHLHKADERVLKNVKVWKSKPNSDKEWLLLRKDVTRYAWSISSESAITTTELSSAARMSPRNKMELKFSSVKDKLPPKSEETIADSKPLTKSKCIIRWSQSAERTSQLTLKVPKSNSDKNWLPQKRDAISSSPKTRSVFRLIIVKSWKFAAMSLLKRLKPNKLFACNLNKSSRRLKKSVMNSSPRCAKQQLLPQCPKVQEVLHQSKIMNDSLEGWISSNSLTM